MIEGRLIYSRRAAANLAAASRRQDAAADVALAGAGVSERLSYGGHHCKDIQALRKATGAGILDARRALQETDGDFEKAKRWLREQGLAGASAPLERERAEGAVSVVVIANSGVGAVVALECETDFVAKSADFVRLVDTLAEDLAA